jgi:hypothetical protein
MTPAQHLKFRRVIDAVCALDAEFTMFEILIHHVLTRHLDANFIRPPLRVLRQYSLPAVRPQAERMLSALASCMAEQPETAAKAFAHAVKANEGTQGWTFVSIPESDQLAAVCDGLDALGQATFQIRKVILIAVTELVLHDQRIRPAEAEWIRLIADALECPIPPWVKG